MPEGAFGLEASRRESSGRIRHWQSTGKSLHVLKLMGPFSLLTGILAVQQTDQTRSAQRACCFGNLATGRLEQVRNGCTQICKGWSQTSAVAESVEIASLGASWSTTTLNPDRSLCAGYSAHLGISYCYSQRDNIPGHCSPRLLDQPNSPSIFLSPCTFPPMPCHSLASRLSHLNDVTMSRHAQGCGWHEQTAKGWQG